MDTRPPRRYIIGDTETCGLGDDKKACQIGLIEIDPATLLPMWELEQLIDPQWPISPGAAAIHGITDQMVFTEPTLAEFIERDLAGGLAGEITLIGHNIRFDRELLEPLALAGGFESSICTLEDSRYWLRGPKNYKLGTLAEFYGFPPDTAHKALADCQTTLKLLRKIVEASGKTLDQLAHAAPRTIHIMPWGRHQGLPLSAVPTSYFDWMLSECENLEPNLKRSIEAERARR